MELNDKDWKILESCLNKPKRFKDLKDLDISEATVHRRTKKLREKGYLKKVPLQDTAREGYKTVPEEISELPNEYMKELEEIIDYLEEKGYYDRDSKELEIPSDKIIDIIEDNSDSSIFDPSVLRNTYTKGKKDKLDAEILDHFTKAINKILKRGRSVEVEITGGKIKTQHQGNLLSLTIIEDKDKFLKEIERRNTDFERDPNANEIMDTLPSKEFSEERECDGCGKSTKKLWFYEKDYKNSEILCKDCRKKDIVFDGVAP